MSKFLDQSGLEYFWGKIKSYISSVVKVTGVKGNNETTYRTGDVNLTPANIGASSDSHTHGNITNAGDITTSATIASGDRLVINDESASKITNSSITFGTSTTKYLSNAGTWVDTPTYAAGTGLSLSGTTFNHSNSITAQTTQSVYPIKIDAQGHISEYGSAVTIPTKTSELTNDSGFITNAGVTGVKGNSESSYRTGQVNLTAANVGAVSISGNETISGNKTFSGVTTLSANSIYPASQNTILTANAAAIIQSPIPKYLWHDIIGFCRATTPTYYTTTNGSTWVETTLEKRLFAHMNAWGNQQILNSSVQGSRWVWHGGGFAYSSLSWIVLGITYNANIATFDLLLEATTDATADSPTWTTLCSVTGAKYNQQPIWIKSTTNGGNNDLRLTITRTDGDTTTNTLSLCAIEFLTTRWGDQGKGSEFEYPFNWNGTPDIYPIKNNVSNLGTSSYKWANVYATTFNGNLTGTASGNLTSSSTLDWNKVTTNRPTTLSGYGITDAKISNGVITLGGNTITPLTSYTETDPIFSASAAAGITSSDITNWNSKTSNTGTVTSVRVQATSPVQSSTSTAQTSTLNTTISLADGYGDTKNPYASKTKNYVLAAPSTANGVPSFRALVAADIPTLTVSKISDFPTIPSKTSELTNDSGFITSYTDTKLQVSDITSGTTYYPIVGTGTTASTRQYDTSGFSYIGTNGNLSVMGTAKLVLGNNIASGTINNKQGQIVLYGSSSYATTITSGGPTAARTITLPNASGTVALTSNIPTVPTNISAFNNDVGYITSYVDTKNTAGSTDTSSKIFLIGATTQSANPQTYSHDTAYVGTNGHLYSASKEVLVGGSNSSSDVTITPSTTSVYSMSSTGSVTTGTAAKFTRGTFNGGALNMSMDTTDTKKLNISFTAATHANDTFIANTATRVTLPGRTQVIGIWNGYTSAVADAQTFTGATS